MALLSRGGSAGMRRLYGFIVSGDVLGEFCRNGNHAFKVTGPVPESASFWSSHFDPSRNAFVVVFEDESFPPVAEGAVIPIGVGPEIGLYSENARIEELQIEVERLKNWIGRIGHEAWKQTPLAIIEAMAEKSIKHSSCACHPEWGATQDWAALGEWPPKTKEELERLVADPS